MDTRVFLPEHIFEICETSFMSIKSVRGPKIMVPLKNLSQKPPPPPTSLYSRRCSRSVESFVLKNTSSHAEMCIKALPTPNQENAIRVIDFTVI